MIASSRTIEAGSVEALLGLVEKGLGFAIAPRSLISGTTANRIIVNPFGHHRWVNIHLLSNQQDRTRLCYALSSIAAKLGQRILGLRQGYPESQFPSACRRTTNHFTNHSHRSDAPGSLSTLTGYPAEQPPGSSAPIFSTE